MLFVHISDLHFRKSSVGTALDPYAHIRNELLRDAKEMCTKINAAPDAVLITGDLAFAGQKEEFEFAYDWLKKLCEDCSVKFENIFLVPGNHDVDRGVIRNSNLIKILHESIKSSNDAVLENTISSLLLNDETSELLYKSLGNYNDFAGDFFCDLLPPERTIAKRDFKLNDGSILRLNGLNSTFVSSESDDTNRIVYVDPSANQIIRETGVENIILCHHPYEWIKKGNILRDHLNDVSRIQLFGHVHTNRIDLTRDYMRISASAAHPDRQEQGWEPGYNLIQLEVTGKDTHRELKINAHVRIWQERPGQFRAKMDRENDVFHSCIELEPWSGGGRARDCEEKENQKVDASKIVIQDVKDDEDSESKVDPMDTLREISVRFLKLSFSQKSAIAGELDLLKEEDTSEPDFERFRRVLIRAKEQDLIEELNKAVMKRMSC